MQRYTFCCFCILMFAAPGWGQKFLPDDPLWYDDDQMDVPAPAKTVISQYYDFYENSFGDPRSMKGPAENVNSLGEVPNSSWYTNRHYWHPMDTEALQRGPNRGEGPSMAEKWLIIRGKGEGITPGFTIKDARGDLYVIKFDPPGHPEMATGSEIISTKLFYALGYHVPENYLLDIEREQLLLSPEATTSDIFGNILPLTQQKVDEMLEQVPRVAPGRFRVLASKLLSGKPLGPFRYYGTRPDDANDIFPHESHRELRGFRVFCAWLNHDDSRSVNTLDMLVSEGDKNYVRHYLIDFGSTLGSGSVFAQRYRPGNEYLLEMQPVLKSIFTLGLWVRPWLKVHYPDYPSIGRFEGDFFDPQKWKPEYPNPAFQNCDAEDAFWAAKQVMNFSGEEIRAVVGMAGYSNPDAQEYLINTLIKRRDKIGAAYLKFGGGLDRFGIEKGRLLFEDLPVKHGLVASGTLRRVQWQEFNNVAGEAGKLLDSRTLGTETESLGLTIPPFESEFAMVSIVTPEVGSTRVFIRRGSGGPEVVGIERE